MGFFPKIKIGIIRKITTEVEGFKKGMKIKAKIPYIPAFLKKDTYEIIGIITDTGTKPVILCSNGHTIWCDEKSKELFDFIDEKSPEFEKNQVTKNEEVLIKYQSGDFIIEINNLDYSLLYCWDSSRCRFRLLPDASLLFTKFHTHTLYEKNTYKTIPMPRFNSSSKLINNVCVIPNYHGGFTIKKGSVFNIQMEEI
jgi:hypothetical protein